MRQMLCFALCAALAACAMGTQRDVALAGHDLNDPRVVATLGAGLTTSERAAFATYALLHWPNSKSFCGQPTFSKKPAATVGEAIEETVGFERALERKRLAERDIPNFWEQRAIDEQRLVDAFDQLTLDRDMVASSDLPQRSKEARLSDIDRKLDQNRAARRALAAKKPPTS